MNKKDKIQQIREMVYIYDKPIQAINIAGPLLPELHKEIEYLNLTLTILIILEKYDLAMDLYEKAKGIVDADKINNLAFADHLQDLKNEYERSHHVDIGFNEWAFIRQNENTQDAVIKNINISGPNIVVLNLNVDCPSCHKPFIKVYEMNLIGDIQGNCPHCFGRYKIEHDTVGTIIYKKFSDKNVSINELNDQLLKISHTVDESRFHPDEDVPEIVTYLNQDYMFFFNKMVMNDIMNNK